MLEKAFTDKEIGELADEVLAADVPFELAAQFRIHHEPKWGVGPEIPDARNAGDFTGEKFTWYQELAEERKEYYLHVKRYRTAIEMIENLSDAEPEVCHQLSLNHLQEPVLISTEELDPSRRLFSNRLLSESAQLAQDWLIEETLAEVLRNHDIDIESVVATSILAIKERVRLLAYGRSGGEREKLDPQNEAF